MQWRLLEIEVCGSLIQGLRDDAQRVAVVDGGAAIATNRSAKNWRMNAFGRRTTSVTGRRRYALISFFAGFAAPVHAIVSWQFGLLIT